MSSVHPIRARVRSATPQKRRWGKLAIMRDNIRLRQNDRGFIEIHAHRAMASFGRGTHPTASTYAPLLAPRWPKIARLLRYSDQSQMECMDQRGGLQRVVPPFAFCVAASHTASSW
jgi:hypothetical protein